MAGFGQDIISTIRERDIARGGICVALLALLVLIGSPLWIALVVPFLTYAGLRLAIGARPAVSATVNRESLDSPATQRSIALDGLSTEAAALGTPAAPSFLNPQPVPHPRETTTADDHGQREIRLEPLNWRGLTDRERAVLCMLAAGNTDQQIADTLFVSKRTASGHVSSILEKFDVDSRTKAAVYAERHGLC